MVLEHEAAHPIIRGVSRKVEVVNRAPEEARMRVGMHVDSPFEELKITSIRDRPYRVGCRAAKLPDLSVHGNDCRILDEAMNGGPRRIHSPEMTDDEQYVVVAEA